MPATSCGLPGEGSCELWWLSRQGEVRLRWLSRQVRCIFSGQQVGELRLQLLWLPNRPPLRPNGPAVASQVDHNINDAMVVTRLGNAGVIWMWSSPSQALLGETAYNFEEYFRIRMDSDIHSDVIF
ncbi:unnamed protein product [Urochloa humidicola]